MGLNRVKASHRQPERLSGVRLVLLVFLAAGLARPRSDAKAQGIDFSTLENIANLTQVTYQGNQFNPSTGVLTTYARVKNITADREIDAPLVLVIDSFSAAGIIPLNPDGMTPGGKPFYNCSLLLGGDMILAPGEVSGPKQILLRNPARRPFSFQATVWGMPAPVCTNDTQCDDDNPCTDDVCTAGHCVNTDNTASCDDGNACTTQDACSGGSCLGVPVGDSFCDDGNACTDDTCTPALGCQHVNNAVPCDDGLFCTTGDACAGGICTGNDTCPGLLCDEVNSMCLAPPPTLNPHPTMTANPSIVITGLAPGGTIVEIAGGFGQSAFQVMVNNGGFVADVPLEPNSLNQLYFATISSNGTRSAPASARITQDSQPPSLFIDFPADGAMVTTTDADVGGRVSDLLSGFMGLNVMVNGVAAVVDVGIGTNGTFVRTAVPLNVGPNMISATATDQLGNSVNKQISITRVQIPAGAPRMFIASGNRQTGEVHLPLNDPIVVQVQRGDGTPFANKLVTFKVTRSDGRLATWAGGPGQMMLQVRADDNGLARLFWRMGSDAGCGNNRVEATSTDILGTVLFCASATPGAAVQINVGSGNHQRAEAGSQAPEPLRVWVSDTCNGVANVPVAFFVRRGGGKVNGLDEVSVNTSDTGHAEVMLTLGPESGHNEIEATYPNNPAAMGAFFTIYGVKRDVNMPTSFSGLVMDNGNRPIGGAHITLVVVGIGHFTDTNEQGQFNFDNLPEAGPADLIVDGLVATSMDGNPISPGSFPFLHYEPVLIPNAANSLPSLIQLPALNPNNARVYNGLQDVALTVEGVEGLKMLVKAGSMRRRDGTIPTPANPAIIALNQVHHDDLPMPMPDGAAPPFAWTLQPAGAKFDPPIQITYPNMSGLPAGSIAYILSFNHDTMRFEIVASGHVTDDGQSIVSDPGAGLNLAGWGCNCPPYSVTGDCCECDECETCNCGQCVAESCDSDECCGDCQICQDGQCVNLTVSILSAAVETNSVGVQIGPAGVQGAIRVFLDDLHLSTAANVAGGQSYSVTPAFGSIDSLPDNREFQKVKVEWMVRQKSCQAEFAYHIKVLGTYRHSQYNVPRQSDSTCQGGGQEEVYMIQLAGGTCTFQQTTLPGTFASQVRINGTGRSSNFGIIKPETATDHACLNSPNRPPGVANNKLFRSNLPNVTGACGTVSNVTVAAHIDHPDLDCGDVVYINTIARKTVRDRCPACGPPTRSDFKQLDNFNDDDGRCTHIVDLGDFKTIKLFSH